MESNNSMTSNVSSLMQNENFFVLRAMFYMVLPHEAYFKEQKDVPDLVCV